MALFTDHCCSHWKCKLMPGLPLLPLMMQVASMPLGLVSTQGPLISSSTRSLKLPFIQKVAAVIVRIVWETVGRTYVQDKINIQANIPSPLLTQSSVQKGGCIFGSLRYTCWDWRAVVIITTKWLYLLSYKLMKAQQCKALRTLECHQFDYWHIISEGG